MADDGSSPLRPSAFADFFMHKMPLQTYKKKHLLQQQQQRNISADPDHPFAAADLESSEDRDRDVDVINAAAAAAGKNVMSSAAWGSVDTDVSAAAASENYNYYRDPAIAADRPYGAAKPPQLQMIGGSSNSSSYVTGATSSSSSSSSSKYNTIRSTNTDDDNSLLSVKVRVLETLVANMFSSLASLRSSYTRIQSAAQAMSSVESAAFSAADRAMVAELTHLSRLQQSYVERNAIVSGGGDDGYREPAPWAPAPAAIAMAPTTPVIRSSSSSCCSSKDALLKSYEGLIQSLQAEVAKKKAEVESLKDWLAESTLIKEKLERKVKKLLQQVVAEGADAQGKGTAGSGGATNAIQQQGEAEMLVEKAVQQAAEACGAFTRLLVSLMRAAEWDLEAACRWLDVDIPRRFSEPSHEQFALESYVSRQMWHGFESPEFYVHGEAIASALIEGEEGGGVEGHRQRCWEEYMAMAGVDAVQLISASRGFSNLFARFCLKKFLLLLHPKMETSLFGNSDHRKHIVEGKHPNSQLYHSFLRLAKSVWLVHRLAFACKCHASIFQARAAMPFSSLYMSSVLPQLQPASRRSREDVDVVAFPITPGFLVGAHIVVKCQVYLQCRT